MSNSDIIQLFIRSGIISIIIASIFLIILYIFYIFSKRGNFKKFIFISIFFGYISGLIYITLFSFPRGIINQYGIMEWDIFASINRALNTSRIDLAMIEFRNIFLNIFLFLPFGLILPFIGKFFKKFIVILFLGLLLSVSIEALQFIFERGVFSIEDIMYNTIGAIIGYTLYIISIKIYSL